MSFKKNGSSWLLLSTLCYGIHITTRHGYPYPPVAMATEKSMGRDKKCEQWLDIALTSVKKQQVSAKQLSRLVNAAMRTSLMGYLGSDDDDDADSRKASSVKPKSHGKMAIPPTAEHFDISFLDGGTDEEGCRTEGDSDSNWVDAAIDSVFGNLNEQLDVASRASAGTQTQTVTELSLQTAILKIEFLETKVSYLYETLAEVDLLSNQAIKEIQPSVPSKSISASARPSAEEELDARLEAMVAAHAERMTMIRLSPEHLFESICRDVEQGSGTSS